MKMVKKGIRFVISGVVQGVFFRQFAKEEADRLGLEGFARNLENGDVEIVAEGEDEKIEEFLKICRKGPEGSHVQNVKKEERKFSGEFKQFRILRI